MKPLDQKAIFDAFPTLWQRLQKEFFKLETLAAYDEDSERPLLELFKAGKRGELIARLREEAALDPLWKDAEVRHLLQRRVHLVDLPLSPYLEFEMQTYRVNQERGEEIFLALRNDLGPAGLSLSDFLLFDAFAAVVQKHDERGRLICGELLETSTEISPLCELKAAILRVAQPFEPFCLEHGIEIKH